MNDYFHSMLPPDEDRRLHYIPTLTGFLAWIESEWSDLPALSDESRTFSYRQMCSRIARRRHLLERIGLNAGDSVAILDFNSINAVESFLAVTSAGMTAIMLPSAMPTPQVIQCLERFNAKAILTRESLIADLAPCHCTVESIGSIDDLETPAFSMDKDAPAAIFFTGGTTGTPKGAILPHRALMRGAFNGCFAPGRQLACHKTIGFLPLSHVFGMIRGMLSELYIGAEWHAAEDLKRTLVMIPQIKPTLLVLVPGLCDMLFNMVRLYGKSFLGGRLRLIISGAANVPPRLISEFHSLGIELLAGYGLTEGANFTTGNASVLTHPESIGKVYSCQEMKIVDGELWIRGDNLFLGYYGQSGKESSGFTPDGWFMTGDLGYMDSDGFVYLTGRKKNLIILPNGENVSPESIEALFYREPEVRDCLVSEKTLNGVPVLAVDILPDAASVKGLDMEQTNALFTSITDRINSSLPSTHRIAMVNVRKEDFKRTGSLKVARNQN